jgi:hypothetical protein
LGGSFFRVEPPRTRVRSPIVAFQRKWHLRERERSGTRTSRRCKAIRSLRSASWGRKRKSFVGGGRLRKRGYPRRRAARERVGRRSSLLRSSCTSAIRLQTARVLQQLKRLVQETFCNTRKRQTAVRAVEPWPPRPRSRGRRQRCREPGTRCFGLTTFVQNKGVDPHTAGPKEVGCAGTRPGARPRSFQAGFRALTRRRFSSVSSERVKWPSCSR